MKADKKIKKKKISFNEWEEREAGEYMEYDKRRYEELRYAQANDDYTSSNRRC